MFAGAEAKLRKPGPRKLLSLDGGGIRGLITIEILSRIERIVREESGNPELVLADYFDYIAGTSTGAVIGTLLSLGKSVDQIRRIYLDCGRMMFDKDTILGLKAYQYDIVCNGYELSSGAIRNHDPDVMLKAFEIAGYAREETEEKFKGMINAFRHGAPPHGGTAPGIDRIVMLLAGEENLREVTMFPMTQSAQDLLMNAPSPANPKQLKELHLRVVYPEKS